MAAGVSTIKRGGSRLYIDPTDAEKKVPGVTSVLNMLPKPFLTFWNAKLVAETAVAQIDTIVRLAERDPAGAIDYLKGAPRRFTQQAANLGSDAHDLFERMARGEKINPRHIHSDLVPFALHFAAWLEEIKPTFLHLEETVWSDTYGYAGSFDAIAVIDGETVIIDWKTTRSGVHEDVSLQLKAYASADRIILASTGESVPLPQIDAAAVLHVRPEGAELVPVDYSDDLFAFFLALLKIYEWDTARKKRVIGKPAWRTGHVKTGTERRAA